MDKAKRNKLEGRGWTIGDAEQFLSTEDYTTQDAIDGLLSDITIAEGELDESLHCRDAFGTRLWSSRLWHLRECLDILQNPKSKLLRDTEEYMEALLAEDEPPKSPLMTDDMIDIPQFHVNTQSRTTHRTTSR